MHVYKPARDGARCCRRRGVAGGGKKLQKSEREKPHCGETTQQAPNSISCTLFQSPMHLFTFTFTYAHHWQTYFGELRWRIHWPQAPASHWMCLYMPCTVCMGRLVAVLVVR